MGSAKYFARDGFFGLFGFPLSSLDYLNRATTELCVQYSQFKDSHTDNHTKTKIEREKWQQKERPACQSKRVVNHAVCRKQSQRSVTSVWLTSSSIPCTVLFVLAGMHSTFGDEQLWHKALECAFPYWKCTSVHDLAWWGRVVAQGTTMSTCILEGN
jgi:hypothetical protein